ncbi:MAG: ImmA/IrrE family metallo-endopeptidase [Spirochaetales bacterium]|jgi:hypothetical protein|nr:ImmA/IrrE family metallo-endopeptidase [Spirochaetales bacterium]
MEPFPIREAERLLKGWGVDSLPVKPKQIAAQHGILCQEMPSVKEGVSGMLVKNGDSFGILYSTHIPVVGFHNFSIAHELGHYFLPEHPENVFSGGQRHESHSGFVSDDKYEKQADQFGCGLLMPSFLFDRALDNAGTGMAAVLHLAELCETSRTATAIRYAQRHTEPTAIVISSNGIIEYCFMSHELKYYKGITWPKKGTAVPRGSNTKGITAQQVLTGGSAEGISDMASWFRLDRDIKIYEEVFGLGSYGKALTVLSCEELPDAEEMEQEEALEESWTPRFRR